MNPKYPIYIVSKGRWATRLTSKALERLTTPYFIVVEQDEWQQYSSVVDPSKVLGLPQSYLDEYETCDDLGSSKGKGPGAARNFCLDHSKANGFRRHWVMDDNIPRFHRLNRNLMVVVSGGSIFRAMEDFVDRYENVRIAGPNYDFFAKAKEPLPPYVVNTRIYSCLLIDNSIKYRWRGRYNEDTDLSLRVLKDGDCTVQFNAFLQEKATTQTVKGGNTDMFYSKEGTKPKSEMLVKLHPDVSKLVWKFNRWHHQVDYGRFKQNRLARVADISSLPSVDNYGMVLKLKTELG